MTFNDTALMLGNQGRPFSFSKLDVAKTCGFKYTKKYIERVKPTDLVDGSAALVGTIVHSILEDGVKVFLGSTTVPTPAEVLGVVDRLSSYHIGRSPVTSLEKEKVALLLGNVAILLNRFLKAIIEHKAKVYLEAPAAIDQYLNPMSFDDPKSFFRGKIDMVVVYPNGAVEVIDHKTSRVFDGQTSASLLQKYQDQLRAYEILVYHGLRKKILHEHGIEIKAVRTGLAYVVIADLIKTPKPTTLDVLSKETTEWFVDWVNKLSDRAQEGSVNRASHCKWCEYKTACGSRVGKGRKIKAVAL
jgi:hypothetical protein